MSSRMQPALPNFFDSELKIKPVVKSFKNTLLVFAKVVVLAKLSADKLYYINNNFPEYLVDDCTKKRSLLRRSERRLEIAARELISNMRINPDEEKDLSYEESFDFLEKVAKFYPDYHIRVLFRESTMENYDTNEDINPEGWKKMSVCYFEWMFDSVILNKRILGDSNGHLITPRKQKTSSARAKREWLSMAFGLASSLENQPKSGKMRKYENDEMNGDDSINLLTEKMAQLRLV